MFTGSQVISGGTAINTTVKKGGIELVSDGGFASGAVISSGGILERIGSDTVSATTFLSGAILEFGPGFVGSDAAVSNGVTVKILSGGTDLGNTAILSGGRMEVLSGGLANNAIVSGGGSMFVLSKGSANATTLSSGGFLTISKGGSGNEGILSGGVENDFGTVIGDLVKSGGTQIVFIIGTASSTTIIDGGTAIVRSGGIESAATISGAESTTPFLQVMKGGLARGVIVDGGELAVLSGGTAAATTVGDFGNEIVSVGGTDFAAQIAGYSAIQHVYGLASGVTLLSSIGEQEVFSPALSSAPQ